jgi:TonB family protein
MSDRAGVFGWVGLGAFLWMALGQAATLLAQEDQGSGYLAREVIQSVIRGERRALRECAMFGTPPAPVSGRVDVTFRIGADGRVQAAEPTRSTLGAEADTCVVEFIRGLVFPAPDPPGEVSVRYPFLFSFTSGDGPGERRGNTVVQVETPEDSGLSGCLMRHMLGVPGTEREWIGHLMVNSDGSVTDASISGSEPGGAELEQCLLEALRALRFPASAEPSRSLEYPFAYRAWRGPARGPAARGESDAR